MSIGSSNVKFQKFTATCKKSIDLKSVFVTFLPYDADDDDDDDDDDNDDNDGDNDAILTSAVLPNRQGLILK